MIMHNVTEFHQNRMLSSLLIVFTDKVTGTHTDRHTDKSDHNTPSHFMWRGNNDLSKKKKKKREKKCTQEAFRLRDLLHVIVNYNDLDSS